jgi:serine/threonine protein phosphatase PrpC
MTDPTPEPSPFLDVCARTHVGMHRPNNEDRLLIADLTVQRGEFGAFAGRIAAGDGAALLAVCDGMGGEAGGEVASSTAVSALYRGAQARLPDPSAEGVARGLFETVLQASAEIEAIGRSQPELRRMGTTATVCTVADRMLFVAHVGDSRAYLLRNGALVQLTRDQTLVTLLLERGQLTPDEVKTSEMGHVILQALGHPGGVDVDLGSVALCRGDILLVCSDGLYGCVDDRTMANVLASKSTPTECCDELVELALLAGGPDNVTCVVARCEGAFDAPGNEPPALRKVALGI